MKKAVKIILIIFAVIFAVIAVLVVAGAVYLYGFPVTHKGQKYVEKYPVYFTEDDFGEYESVTFKVKDRQGLFRSVGSMFVVTYTDEQYDQQIQKVNEREFLDEADQRFTVLPAEQVEADGWLVRILDNGAENNYPKEIAMIGTNNEKKTIIYMYFTDRDLDRISETDGEEALKDFIEEHFSFKF